MPGARPSTASTGSSSRTTAGGSSTALPATVEALPEIVDAVGNRMEVLLDGGVRRGADVVRALALGARAVMVGRPYLYGLAVGGSAGVRRALEILANEVDHALALTGVPRVGDLDRTVVRRADAP